MPVDDLTLSAIGHDGAAYRIGVDRLPGSYDEVSAHRISVHEVRTDGYREIYDGPADEAPPKWRDAATLAVSVRRAWDRHSTRHGAALMLTSISRRL